MNAVIYYSNSNQSKAIADYLASELNLPSFDVIINKVKSFENLILVFPVYSQNIPQKIIDFLENVEIQYLSLVATYGKMSFGNVLYEISQQFQFQIVAAAYVPTKHTYLPHDISFNDYAKLSPLLTAIKAKRPIVIPKAHKNLFANFFPTFRSRIGVKIIKTFKCNECNLCQLICPLSAIRNGKTNNKCIRCLKCVYHCPQQALSFKLAFPLKKYLQKKPIEDLIIYK